MRVKKNDLEVYLNSFFVKLLGMVMTCEGSVVGIVVQSDSTSEASILFYPGNYRKRYILDLVLH